MIPFIYHRNIYQYVFNRLFYGCVAIGNMGLYTSDIGWVRWVNIVHETVCRQWFGVA